MKNKTSVSVIMPCYNSEKYIADAIESILGQTFKDFELIIVNDGSTDGTEKAISPYLNDSRVRYRKLQQQRGNYPARNIGLDLASGDFVAVMDADDISRPNRLTIQYRYLKTHKEVGCVGSFAQLISKNNKMGRIWRRPTNFEDIKVMLLENNCFIHSSIMLRKSFLFKYGLRYDEKLPYAADYDLLVRCSNYFRIENLQDVLINYRVHPDQISNTKRIHQKKYADIIRLKQLKKFHLETSSETRNLYLKFLNKEMLSELQIQLLVNFSNSILAQNHRLGNYPSSKLFDFYNSRLKKAFQIRHKKLYSHNLWNLDQRSIKLIQKKLKAGSTILELGSGAGTSILLQRYRVISIEHDPLYAVQRSTTHKCTLAPITGGWYERSAVSMALRFSFDLLIIDGPCGIYRKNILSHLHLFKNIQTPILFDDVNRPNDFITMKEFCKKLKYNFFLYPCNNKIVAFCEKKIERITY